MKPSAEVAARRAAQIRQRDEADMVRLLCDGLGTHWEAHAKDRNRVITLSKKYPTFAISWRMRLERLAQEKIKAEIAELRQLHKEMGWADRNRYELLKVKYAHRKYGAPAAIDLWGFETARALRRAVQAVQPDPDHIARCKAALAQITGDAETMLIYRRMIEDDFFPDDALW